MHPWDADASFKKAATAARNLLLVQKHLLVLGDDVRILNVVVVAAVVDLDGFFARAATFFLLQQS